MGIKQLKTFRIIVPGLLVLLLIVFLQQDDFNIIENIKEIQFKDGLYLIVVLIFGAIYYLLRFRSILWRFFNGRIQNNIRKKMISPFAKDYTEEEIDKINEKGKLMNAFYKIIDNDESLKEKSNNVRLNGLIWTSAMDMAIISALGAVVSWIMFFIQRHEYNSTLAWYLIIIAIISVILVEIATRRHISLSNEQLEMICQVHKDELKERLNECL